MRTPKPNEDQAIFDIVFHGRTKRSISLASRLSVGSVFPWLIAIGLHAVLLLVALKTEPSLESWSARMATLIHADLAASVPVKIEPLPIVKPPPETPPPSTPEPPSAPPRTFKTTPKRKSKSRRSIAKRETASKRQASRPTKRKTPAQAGQIVSAKSDPAAPVDLTNALFVTGRGDRYVGGVTSAQGTSKEAVMLSSTEPNKRRAKRRGPSQARAVSLEGNAWRCAWPRAAMNREIYEQFVVLKAVVRSDGSVKSARVIRDPGDGFGEAAVACALRTRFNPAQDREGRPVDSTSPPIKVRFTR